MINLNDMIEIEITNGYGDANAQAKVCQDIDFIRYSLGDNSIDLFINKLNCLEGIAITRHGDIEELKQQD